jgi:uncharacterized membrane protein YeaQ/YmgE (transglycosylase-associated protein family)
MVATSVAAGRRPAWGDGIPQPQEQHMIGAIILGLVAGFIGKALLPGKDPGGFFVTIVIGLVGALVGWAIFTKVLGIGDDDIFDLGGLLGAIVGVIIVLLAIRAFAGRSTTARR